MSTWRSVLAGMVFLIVPRFVGCAAAAAALDQTAAAKYDVDRLYDLIGSKQHEEAIAECTRRINFGSGSVHDRAYCYDCRGAAYYNKGDEQQALADSSAAIELEPTADRHYERGKLYQELRRHD